MARCRWRIHLTQTAETDYRNILRWTSEHFGERQAHVYPSLHFSPRGEAKWVRGPSGRGASRLARAGVLERYVEHGKQAQRSPGGRIACFDRRVVRNAGYTLTAAIEALTEGPDVIGSRKSNDIGEGVRVLHVAREGRKGRHFVLYRVRSQAEPPAIDVLRLLHDSMDLPRHVVSTKDNDH